MGISDDLIRLEQQLGELITRYDQYFNGLEKREPLQLRTEVERLIRSYVGTQINNTMYRHRYYTLTARFNTYREHWGRILRLIDEGRFTRDRFISDLHQQRRPNGAASSSAASAVKEQQPPAGNDLDRVFREYRDARAACNLPVDGLSIESLSATLDKQRPVLADKLGTNDIVFRVVVEQGKPKIKAGKRS